MRETVGSLYNLWYANQALLAGRGSSAELCLIGRAIA